MTEAFEIKETVLQTGYIDQDGKFVPETDPNKVKPMKADPIYVQAGEDVTQH